MKYVILLVLIFAVVFYFGSKTIPSSQLQPKATEFPIPSQSPAQKPTKGLFVPYWSFTNLVEADGYDTLYYFGIAPSDSEINKKENGYKKVAQFASSVQKGQQTVLVVRMTQQDTNFSILKNKNAQQKIINDTIALAKEYQFNGIALDLEIASLPFASLTEQINSFVETFYANSKKQQFTFTLFLYGDTFAKVRPYDVIVLKNNADKIFVMAYDFHKANGSPGPNFPFGWKDTYGYDFQTMITDFLNLVPKEKLGVVFGMFGYDWTVDANGESIGQASSLSLHQMEQRFVNGCEFSNCLITRDEASAETKVEYVDQNGNKHVVWFEDEQSAAKKEEFLKQKGITNISFWAYSYF